MNKLSLSLLFGLFLFSSCGKEQNSIPTNPMANAIKSEFRVQKIDIENVVKNFLSNGSALKNSSDYKIVEIDSLQSNRDVNLRNTTLTKPLPENLLYFVKLNDASTLVVAGDKRAEPIYAQIDLSDLKFENGKLLNQEKIPDEIRFMLGVLSASILEQIELEDCVNPHWIKYRPSSGDEIQKPKCKAKWGQGYPFNAKSPRSNGKYADNGKALTGCVTIAIAQALTILKDDFTIFKGYDLKTSWSILRQKVYAQSFVDNDEIEDISSIVKTIAENINISYKKSGAGSAQMEDGVKFLSNYLGKMFGYDNKWSNIKANMKDDSRGISLFCGNGQSNGWFWKMIGIKMPEMTGHCMLLDGYMVKNGQTLFYVNFGWSGYGNGYYLYDDKTWKDDAIAKFGLRMEVANFHLDTDYDDF